MKATLEFDLNDPDERREHSMAVNGRNAYMVLSDVLEEFRSILKYGGSILNSQEEEDAMKHFFEKARNIVLEAMENRDVNLDNLY